jgi:hypothetical protein
VHDHVDAAAFCDDRGDRGVDGGVVGDIHLDRAQVRAPVHGLPGQVGGRLPVVAADVVHGGVDNVACLAEFLDGHPAEAAGGTCNDDDLLGRRCAGHDDFPLPEVTLR